MYLVHWTNNNLFSYRESITEDSQTGRTAYRYSAKPVLNIDNSYQPKPVLGIDTGYQQEWNGLHIPYRGIQYIFFPIFFLYGSEPKKGATVEKFARDR